jgi:hypothetical protein
VESSNSHADGWSSRCQQPRNDQKLWSDASKIQWDWQHKWHNREKHQHYALKKSCEPVFVQAGSPFNVCVVPEVRNYCFAKIHDSPFLAKQNTGSKPWQSAIF